VRDGAGNPLSGVVIQILVSGPPPTPYDNCVTDEGGECRLLIPPGAYRLVFDRGWRGLEFVPPEAQNSGILEDGTSGGGFGVYFAPSDEAQLLTFVVGEQDGRLVPLWDMSRDPGAAPQPFTPPGQSLDGIRLEPLVGTIDRVEETPTAETSPESQVVEDELHSGFQVPEEEGEPEAGPVLEQPPSPGRDKAFLAALGLVLTGLILLGGAYLARWLRRKERS
jgi:hypothetical protein